MKITWHGHACFSITKDNGYTIVFDPHDGHSIGLKRPDVKADLVLVSHDHFDHNAVDIVRRNGTRVLKVFHGETEVDDISIKGIKTFHDKFGGKRRGVNTIYIVEVDGLRMAHLGDLGHIPSEGILKELENIHVLMIPVGGVYTIGPDEAWEIVSKVRPVITIPMHYWVQGLTLPLHTIEDFIAYVKKFRVERLDRNYIEVSKDNLPSENTIIVFKY